MERDLWMFARDYLGRLNAGRLRALEQLAARFGIDYVCAAVCRSESSFDAWLDRAITAPLISRRAGSPAIDVQAFVVGPRGSRHAILN